MQAVSLSQSYAAATTDTTRASYIAAANYALAVLPFATFLSYVISSVGILIIGLVMMRGVFPRIAAAFGMGTGIFGTPGDSMSLCLLFQFTCSQSGSLWDLDDIFRIEALQTWHE